MRFGNMGLERLFTVMFVIFFLGLVQVSLIGLGMELTGFSFWVLMFN